MHDKIHNTCHSSKEGSLQVSGVVKLTTTMKYTKVNKCKLTRLDNATLW